MNKYGKVTVKIILPVTYTHFIQELNCISVLVLLLWL